MECRIGYTQIVCLALGAAGLLACAAADGTIQDVQYGDWKQGRATNYGLDAWSIHAGGCNYGYLEPKEPLGWNVAAMADCDPLYPQGMCGQCLEVKCNPSAFRDNYGMWLDRKGVCYDSQASVVVRVTDTCPCTYAGNAYSNKRWCCCDMPHLDLSYITFQALAPLEQGVIGIQYRAVPCNYVPSRGVATGPQGGGSSMAQLRDWPEYMGGRPQTYLGVFDVNGVGSAWRDSSWNTWVVPRSQSSGGLDGKPALCAQIHLNGALSLSFGGSGGVANRTKLSFWMYVGVTGPGGSNAKVADISIALSGSKGTCSNPRIWAVRPQQFRPPCDTCTDYWWQYEFHLGGFNGGDPASPIHPGDFTGCQTNGGWQSAWDVNRIDFRNDGMGGQGDKYLCLDRISLI